MRGQGLISIIVPVYNVEKYLNICIDSIVGQTYKNLEILLIDDGSQDSSGSICDSYAQIDKRVKVIHKENGGQSSARNVGMKYAKGEYIFFVDSDDYIEKKAIEVLIKTAKRTCADIVIADYYTVYNNDNTSPIQIKEPISYQVLDKIQALDRYIMEDWGPWNKLYKWNVHQTVFFPEGRIHEDEAVMVDLLGRCEKVAVLDVKSYYYRKREGSTTSFQYSLKKMDWYYAWKRNVELVYKSYPKVKQKAVNKMLVTVFYNLDNLLRIGDRENCMEYYIEEIRDTVNLYYPEIRKNPYVRWTKKIRCIILRCSLNLYKKIYIKQ